MGIAFKKGEAPWEVGDQAATQPSPSAPPQGFKAGSAPWETQAATPPQGPAPEQFSTAESGLEGLGQGISFGYLPQLQAGAEVAGNKLLGVLPNALTPKSIEGAYDPNLTYQSAKDQWLKRNAAIATEDPGAYMGGNVAGSLLLPGMGAAKGTTALARVAKAAGTGALIGGLSNPGDVEGQSGSLQIPERIENAQTGAIMGGAMQGLGGALGSAKTALAKGREQLALKLAGARKMHFKDIDKFKTGPKIEAFMEKHGLLTPGKTFEHVLEKSNAVVKSAGEKIGQIHDEVADVLEVASKDHPLIREFFKKNQLTARDMAADVLKTARKELRGTAGGKQALGQLRSEMKNLSSLDGRSTTSRTIQAPTSKSQKIDYVTGKRIMEPVTIKTTKIPETPFKSLLKYRESLDDVAKWNKTFNESTGGQKALKIARRVIKNKLDGRIDEIDKVATAAGIKDMGNISKLKNLNAEYGTAKTVQNMAADKAAAEAAKANIGLLETIAGTGYAASEIAQGKDPMTAITKGLVGGLALRQGRKYGPGLGYKTVKTAEKLMTPGAALAKIPQRAYITPWLEMNKKREEK